MEKNGISKNFLDRTAFMLYSVNSKQNIVWQAGFPASQIEKPIQGVVLVSTGLLKMEKLSACDALNGKIKLNAEENLAIAA